MKLVLVNTTADESLLMDFDTDSGTFDFSFQSVAIFLCV